jgi:sarcosine oxidase subunit beta
MENKYNITIIGGGIIGLTLAYFLIKNGAKNIIIVEKGYLNNGASGRCAGGIRLQWTNPENIELMKESIEFYENFPKTFNHNIWFRQGGYLFLVETEKQLNEFTKIVEMQNEHGVKSKILDKKAVKKLLPYVDETQITGGAFNNRDGILFPWAVIFGLHKYLKSNQVAIFPFTEVFSLEKQGNKITRLVTNKGVIESDLVINAAGAWSKRIAEMVGVKLPNRPVLHEILVTENLESFINPMVIFQTTGLYIGQTLRGEVIMGMPEDHKESLNFTNSFSFTQKITTQATKYLPILNDIKILRMWSGSYDVTPDTAPILGVSPEYQNFIQASGFMGHGFMIAPSICRILAQWITHNKNNDVISKYSIDRFKSGNLIEKESFIVG